MYGDITVNGKRYGCNTFFRNKADANKWAKSHRRLGYKCRVIPAKNSRGEKIYKLYCTR